MSYANFVYRVANFLIRPKLADLSTCLILCLTQLLPPEFFLSHLALALERAPTRNDTVSDNLRGRFGLGATPMKHLRCSNAQRSPAFLARGCFFSCNTWHCKIFWSFQLLLRGSNDVFVIFVCKDNPKLACSITCGLLFSPILSCCLPRLLRDCGPRCWLYHIRPGCLLSFVFFRIWNTMYPLQSSEKVLVPPRVSPKFVFVCRFTSKNFRSLVSDDSCDTYSFPRGAT